MPLTMAIAGSENTVKKVTGKDETRRFLKSLGFVEGERVTVVSEMGGNLIVNVKESRIALSKNMAGRDVYKRQGCGCLSRIQGLPSPLCRHALFPGSRMNRSGKPFFSGQLWLSSKKTHLPSQGLPFSRV